MTPSSIAQPGLTKPAAGVMPTQPTTIAVAAPIAVTWRARMMSSTNQVASVQAGVSSVLTNASTPPSRVENPLPPLKPNQPNHSSPAPTRTYTALWGRIAWRPQSLRAPTTSAAASAEKPEPISTGTPPAKSSVPCACNQPPPNAQCASTAYTSTDHSAAKARKGPKAIRSTTAPDTSAVVTMQNVAWKAMKTSCGMAVPARGANVTSGRNARSKPPMMPLASPNAIE